MTEEQRRVNEQVKQDSDNAAFLLSHPAFDDAFASLANAYQNEWFDTKINQSELRETLWLKIQVMKEIKQLMIQRIKAGVLISSQH